MFQHIQHIIEGTKITVTFIIINVLNNANLVIFKMLLSTNFMSSILFLKLILMALSFVLCERISARYPVSKRDVKCNHYDDF